MAGRRDANLRSGDLAEDVGNLLLKQLAFVVPVPRAEDFGIDAVATLVRRDGRFLYAEDSFLVQYKAASKADVSYKDHEIDWLFDLQLPLFLAWVDRARFRIRLYSVTQHTLNCMPYRRFGLHSTVRFVPDERGVRAEADNSLIVGLGQPLRPLRQIPRPVAL